MSVAEIPVNRPASAFRALLAWGGDFTGSTRPAALMRMALAAIALVRFGAELAPYNAASPSAAAAGSLFFLFAAMSFVGYMSRIAIGGLGAVLFLAIYVHGGLGLGVPGWGHHHVYLLAIACLFLAGTDCGRSYSLDRLRALRAGDAPPERGVLWGQRLIALQLAAMYFWTAVDKTDRAFLSGERLEQIFVWTYSGRALEFLLAFPALIAAMAIAVVVVEYWLAFAILSRRQRRYALPVGLAMHATFYLMLPVTTYSVTVMALYLALIDPDSVHRFIDRMQGAPPRGDAADAAHHRL